MNTFSVTVLVSCISLVGCLSEPTTIEGDDSTVTFRAARASFQFYPAGPALAGELGYPWLGSSRRDEDPPDDSDPEIESETGNQRPRDPIQSLLALDANFAFGAGSFSQDLVALERVVVDDTTFPGPGRLRHEVDVYSESLALRGGVAFTPANLTVSAFAGTAVHTLQLETENSVGGASARRTTNNVGVLIGARIEWDPLFWFGAYAQASTVPNLSGLAELRADSYDLGIRLSPMKPLGVMAGWHWLNWKEEGSSESGTDFQLSGPQIGVELRF